MQLRLLPWGSRVLKGATTDSRTQNAESPGRIKPQPRRRKATEQARRRVAARRQISSPQQHRHRLARKCRESRHSTQEAREHEQAQPDRNIRLGSEHAQKQTYQIAASEIGRKRPPGPDRS